MYTVDTRISPLIGPPVYRKRTYKMTLVRMSVRLSVRDALSQKTALTIFLKFGNPEMQKSERSRFFFKSPPPPFWAQKGQIWAKIALFRNLGKNGSNYFFLTLNNEYQNGYKKMVYNCALQFITFWAFTSRKWAHGDLEIKKNIHFFKFLFCRIFI